MGKIKCEYDWDNPDCGCDKAFEIPCQQETDGKNHTICMSKLYQCDGVKDCMFGEDEEGCGWFLATFNLVVILTTERSLADREQ